ncbi:hypothetical protein B0T12DRAFT_401505 [Alternaria alternata]|nr:hypothetical protein B0T12DRAFT_401505 [Alternaria alternata]
MSSSAFCVTSLPIVLLSALPCIQILVHGSRFRYCHLSCFAFEQRQPDWIAPWSLLVGVLHWCHSCCGMPRSVYDTRDYLCRLFRFATV